MDALLSIEDLAVEFKRDGSYVRAVSGVSYEVKEGQSVGIVGESGSGKSVLMKSVMQLLPPYAHVPRGRVTFKGQDVLKLSKRDIRKIRGREIAMVFQDPHAYLNPTKTIGRQLMEPLLFHHLASGAQAKARAIKLLGEVGIPSPELRFSQYPFEFSGGMLQRVTIAMALMAEPKLLIADEPTTALDVTVQAQILRLLNRLKTERRMSMILVTHDLVVAAKTCDVIIVMYGGTIVEKLPSASLQKKGVHPYARGLIECTPRVHGPLVKPTPIPGAPLNLRRELPAGCLFADRCPKRFERCAQRPPLIQVAPDHEVACWLGASEKSGVSA